MALSQNLMSFLKALDAGNSLDEAIQAGQISQEPPLDWDDLVEKTNDAFDTQMLSILDQTPPPARVRDRIERAVLVRIQVMGPYRRAIRRLIVQGLWPHHGIAFLQSAWKTADIIWYWAGDEATDFNHYTKRTLLLSVMAAGLAAWLKHDEDAKVTAAVTCAIGKVMQIPQLKKKLKNLWGFIGKRGE